jgi:protein TonB
MTAPERKTAHARAPGPHQAHGHHQKPHPLRTIAVRLLLLVAVIVPVLLIRHYVINTDPRATPGIQRITLLEQRVTPPRPRPEPEKPPPEPQQQKPTPTININDLKEPPPGPPPLGALGVNEAGTGNGDSFGLASRQDGRDITTVGDAEGNGIGDGSGDSALSIYRGYALMVRDALKSELALHAELHDAYYTAEVVVWVNPSGRIRKVEVAKSSGKPAIDAALRAAAESGRALDRPPPEDMPQPIRLRIISHKAS